MYKGKLVIVLNSTRQHTEGNNTSRKNVSFSPMVRKQGNYRQCDYSGKLMKKSGKTEQELNRKMFIS